MEQKTSKVCSTIDEIYRQIHSRYDDSCILETILAKAKAAAQSKTEIGFIEALTVHKATVKEVEWREETRKENEKSALAKIRYVVTYPNDKIFAHLVKMIRKMVQQSVKALLYPKYKLSPAMNILMTNNVQFTAPLQNDEILGGHFENDLINCIKPEVNFSVINLIEKYLLRCEKALLYQVLYNIVLESRVRIEDFFIVYYGYTGEDARFNHIAPLGSSSLVYDILVKANMNTARDIEKYKESYMKRHSGMNANASKKVNGAAGRMQKAIELLQGELSKKENMSEVKSAIEKVSLVNILETAQPAKPQEPSTQMIEAYVKQKKEEHAYINQLEDDYKLVEGIKHIRRCLLLHCIVAIQRLFRIHVKNKKSKAATIIQRYFRLRRKRKARKLDIIKKAKIEILSYKRKRWLKLLIKKRRIKKSFIKLKQQTIINERMQKHYSDPIILKKVIKCQALVKRYLAKCKFPFKKDIGNIRKKRRQNQILNKIVKVRLSTIQIDNSIINIKLSSQEEILQGGTYLQQQRTKFEESWKNYVKDLEKESKRANSKHMKDWVTQRDKYGGSYWFNVKTMAQQAAHPGTTWLQKTKEKRFAEAVGKFETSMLPLLTKLAKIKEQCKQTIDKLMEQRTIVSTSTLVS